MNDVLNGVTWVEANMLRHTTFACIFAGLSVLMLPTVAFALCAAAKDMNGVWKGDDRATYYVRQVGNDVWWVGMSVDNGASWTNVFRGVRTGNKVTGTWVDVPKGKNHFNGVLNLDIRGTNSVLEFRKGAGSSGFSTSRWFQPCDDN